MIFLVLSPSWIDPYPHRQHSSRRSRFHSVLLMYRPHLPSGYCVQFVSEEINIDSEDTTTTTTEEDDATPPEPEEKARPRSESWLAKLGRSIKQTARCGFGPQGEASWNGNIESEDSKQERSILSCRVPTRFLLC